jgi:hypothetical protein
MLEEGKSYFRFLAETNVTNLEIVITAETAVNSLHRLQLQLEDTLIEESSSLDD